MIFFPKYKCKRCGEEWLIRPLAHYHEECDYNIKQELRRMVREILCLEW